MNLAGVETQCGEQGELGFGTHVGYKVGDEEFWGEFVEKEEACMRGGEEDRFDINRGG